MKKKYLRIIFTATLCLFTGTFLLAQEEDNKKVHIMVKENDVTTVDTSFSIDKDMDKNEIQKMIHELTGMDVMVHPGDKITHAYAFTIKDSVDIDADADVKEMKIKVIVDGDGESHTVIHKHSSSDHMKWVDHKSGDHIIVKEEDGKKKKSKVIIVSEECEGDEKKEIKKVIVLESSEKPIHFITKDGKEVELIVKDKKTGTDIALDKVKVIRIETSEDGVINIIVSDKKEKVVKKKKVNKEK
ncbi:MAG: hypothetical protein KAT40_01405 [Bacteroidales bacterium]|nr:hypothetical protein [Bacteroidales bacterium]